MVGANDTGRREPVKNDPEITALRRIVAAMGTLDRTTQDRVVTWLYDRYHLSIEEEAAGLARNEGDPPNSPSRGSPS